ncbi:MAG: Gfo/Idh/MocA family oxidoreductase [Planctomycetes bacterium]|nr:Gfo/Idh/MocA family oxidoreductase [Planctomycetota bacterium]
MALRVIQVGVGGFGTGWTKRVHQPAQAVKDAGGTEMAAMVDVNEAVLKQRAQELGLSESCCFTDLDKALATVRADAVLNVTPPAAHKAVTLKAFEARLHVLTEKPLSDSMRDAKVQVAASKKHRRILMVSQNYRFRRWARTIRQILVEKRVGEASNAVVRFAKAPNFPGSFRLKMDFPLVVDMSIHHFDLMRYILGAEPQTVYARSWNPPWSWFAGDPCCMATFGMSNGVNVLYDGSWVTRTRETGWDGEWRVECSEGVIELRGDKVFMARFGQPEQEVPLVSLPAENQDYSLVEFLACLADGREPETSGRDNLASLAMVFATLDSIRSGRLKHVKV